MLTKRDLLRSAAMAALAATTAKSTPAIAQNKAEWPNLLEAKDIAEEGFIYGLPLVMNYAVMQEFAVDTELGAVQGAVQRDQQPAPRRHPGGHGSHHAEQRHALLDSLAGSARRADGDLGAGGRKGPLLLGPADRRQHLQLWLHRQPRHGHRAGRLSGGRPRLERRNARRDQEGLLTRRRRSRSPLIRTQLFNPGDMPNVEKVQAGYKAQPLSAFLKQPAPPAAPKIDFLPATTAGIKENFFQYLDAALQFVPETPRGQGDPREAREDRHRPRQDLRRSRISRSNTRPQSWWA